MTSIWGLRYVKDRIVLVIHGMIDRDSGGKDQGKALSQEEVCKT